MGDAGRKVMVMIIALMMDDVGRGRMRLWMRFGTSASDADVSFARGV
jgi:hypothetical protein